jgi:hypothetical protein
MLLVRFLTAFDFPPIITYMHPNPRVNRILEQIAAKRRQLEDLVGRGLPLTDPGVVALSQALDQLLALLQSTTNPSSPEQ